MTVPDELVRLAVAHGIQPAYRDVDDRLQEASVDALLAALRSLGVDITTPEDADDRLSAFESERWQELLPPVVASFDGASVPIPIRLRGSDADRRLGFALMLEDGRTFEWSEDTTGRAPDEVAAIDGVRSVAHTLHVRDVPHGYHQLVVEVEDRRVETTVIVAPPRAYHGPEDQRTWGVFLPLHALRTSRDWGAGDLSDLQAFGRWAGTRGASVVGTLPLLPVYVGDDTRIEPSPYSPVSRLFWNELTLDLTRSPELDRAPGARELLRSDALAGRIDALRRHDHVDYRELAAVKGQVLGALAQAFFDDPGDRRADLEWFIAQRPEVEDYALFRGAVALHGTRWWEWPERARERDLDLDNVDLRAARYHLYAQLLARDQVASLSRGMRDAGQQPYLDLPIGAIRDGYDVWRHREVFAIDADTGAPPDTIFTGGQNWHFPPLHPRRLRASGYRYLISVLRHHLELADWLRIDHVMGLHRLFWIPQEVDARDGVYVRYPADELYAIHLLESHRHGSRLVGEDLGTVPEEVDRALELHGITRMYVVQYETHPDAYDVLDPVPQDSVASVNTHDMPPFARWWDGLDIEDGIDLGLHDEDEAERQRTERARTRWKVAGLLTGCGALDPTRTEDPQAVHEALVTWLGASDARMVLINLEDLWLEEEPQNTPGTVEERVNWRRRARHGLEEFDQLPSVSRAFDRVARAREDGVASTTQQTARTES